MKEPPTNEWTLLSFWTEKISLERFVENAKDQIDTWKSFIENSDAAQERKFVEDWYRNLAEFKFKLEDN